MIDLKKQTADQTFIISEQGTSDPAMTTSILTHETYKNKYVDLVLISEI